MLGLDARHRLGRVFVQVSERRWRRELDAAPPSDVMTSINPSGQKQGQLEELLHETSSRQPSNVHIVASLISTSGRIALTAPPRLALRNRRDHIHRCQ